MTLRSLFIGLLLAFGISAFTYFNDHVLHGTYLIGNHFPVIVFGALIFLVLGINPLLKLLRINSLLRPGEIGVIMALGLVVCGWPGSSFFRTFASLITNSSKMATQQTNWKATHVMSYVPGASPKLAEGFVDDWIGLAKHINEQRQQSAPTVAGRMWGMIPDNVKSIITKAASTESIEPVEKTLLLNEINQIIEDRDFYRKGHFSRIELPDKLQKQLPKLADENTTDHAAQWINRQLLELDIKPYLLPRPPGEGIVLANGDLQSPAVDIMLQGWEGKENLKISQIPWKTWIPTLQFWGSLALLIAIASLCIILVVQPQWKRELLPYPIAKFVQEFTAPSPGSGLPKVLSSQLFWIGFIAVLTIHTINGLNAWNILFIKIPLQLPFEALGEKLFTTANKYAWGALVFSQPRLYLTVIAFAFFLGTEVSFSVGISGFLFLILFSILTSNGILVKNDLMDPANTGLLRFGSYFGVAIVVFFIGRRYYLNVIGSAAGIVKPDKETPANAVWAARILVLCMAAAVMVLVNNGLDWLLSILLVLMILLTFFIITRINVETGTFFIQPWWGIVGVIVAIFGMPAIGPTAYIIMAIVCALFVLDPREAIMPFLANALFLSTEQKKKNPPNRIAVVLGITMIGGFIVALVATLYFQYNYGLDSSDPWALYGVPKIPFKLLARHITELSAYGELTESMKVSGLGRLSLMDPDYGLLGWALIGFVLVIACSVLRLRLSWWPLHPVAFLVWGSYPGCIFAMSFIIGWMIKAFVVRFGGVKGYRAVKPLMVGVIGGEVIATIIWAVVGAIYFLVTNEIPKTIAIFPG
ncbi:MAG: hypothetical protein GF398_20630 [Chitinivibrionales bacterium]|nr:hypothetical protein [Chitinivibrionales bacterium]